MGMWPGPNLLHLDGSKMKYEPNTHVRKREKTTVSQENNKVLSQDKNALP